MKIVKRNYFDEEGCLLIKPYRIKDFAEIYDVSTKTIRKWIAKGRREGREVTLDCNSLQPFSYF